MDAGAVLLRSWRESLSLTGALPGNDATIFAVASGIDLRERAGRDGPRSGCPHTSHSGNCRLRVDRFADRGISSQHSRSTLRLPFSAELDALCAIAVSACTYRVGVLVLPEREEMP